MDERTRKKPGVYPQKQIRAIDRELRAAKAEHVVCGLPVRTPLRLDPNARVGRSVALQRRRRPTLRFASRVCSVSRARTEAAGIYILSTDPVKALSAYDSRPSTIGRRARTSIGP